MIIKEKMIFWPLLGVFVAILMYGLMSQDAKKAATDELMQDINLATKKSKARIKEEKGKWNLESIKAVDNIEGYKLLLKRSPFLRVRSEEKAKKAEPIPVKEAPKKIMLKYKGRIMMGSKVMVIIEDGGTGKSSFVKEGDTIGDFLVSSIDEAKVVLKKKDGEKLILSAVKKEGEEKQEKTDTEKEKTDLETK